MNIIEKIESAKGRVTYTLFSEPENNIIVYGIDVCTELFGEAETASIRDITSDGTFAKKLLYLLADNLVLPSTLDEVVEEYLAASFTV